MWDKKVVGKLIINVDEEPLELNVLSGMLDRSYSAFEFNSQNKRNINGYNLSVDVSNLAKEAMRDLERIMNTADKMFNVTLNFEGIMQAGKAKIAENLGFSGYSIDLEIHN